MSARPNPLAQLPDFKALAAANPRWSAGILRGRALCRRLHAAGLRSGQLELEGARRHELTAAVYDAAAQAIGDA